MADNDARSGLTTDAQIELMRCELERAATPTQKRKVRGIKALSAILSVFFVIFVMTTIFTLLQIWSVREQGKTPALFGLYLYGIETDRMEPLLPSGSIILAKETQHPDMLQAGDIVTFLTPEGNLSTRMIADVFVDKSGVVAYHTSGPGAGDPADSTVLSQDRIQFVMLFPIPFFS